MAANPTQPLELRHSPGGREVQDLHEALFGEGWVSGQDSDCAFLLVVKEEQQEHHQLSGFGFF